MNRFTIFTILFAITVVTVTVNLAVHEYYTKQSQASVIRQPPAEDSSKSADEKDPASPEIVSPPPAPADASSKFLFPATPKTEPSAPPVSSRITQHLINEAGFPGELTEQHFAGKVFQLLDITKIPVAGISFYEILRENVAFSSITEMVLADEIRALQLYVLLQNKTKTYIDLSLNETNAYGDRSFYINHAKKPDEAFLVVKMGKSLYAFAYIKPYHAQIKRLIQLLELSRE